MLCKSDLFAEKNDNSTPSVFLKYKKMCQRFGCKNLISSIKLIKPEIIFGGTAEKKNISSSNNYFTFISVVICKKKKKRKEKTIQYYGHNFVTKRETDAPHTCDTEQ